MGGQALGDYLLGPDDVKESPIANATATPKARAIAGRAPPPADATTPKTKNALTGDQVLVKLADASDRSAMLLKGMKENSDRTVDLMREEVAVIRGMSDRLGRLLEEGNRNTRTIADHGA
jgi:hypothetical protein